MGMCSCRGMRLDFLLETNSIISQVWICMDKLEGWVQVIEKWWKASHANDFISQYTNRKRFTIAAGSPINSFFGIFCPEGFEKVACLRSKYIHRGLKQVGSSLPSLHFWASLNLQPGLTRLQIGMSIDKQFNSLLEISSSSWGLHFLWSIRKFDGKKD